MLNILTKHLKQFRTRGLDIIQNVLILSSKKLSNRTKWPNTPILDTTSKVVRALTNFYSIICAKAKLFLK